MNILIAEDEEITRMLLCDITASWGLTVHEAEDGQEALEILERNSDIQLVFADWMMPRMDGPELCQRLKAMEDRFFYIIMLTGHTGTENLVKAIESGADDYIAKPFSPEEVRIRLKAGTRIVKQEQKVSVLANYDDLTGLWNRRMILKFLHSNWQRSIRERTELGILLFDLDYFKRINDTHGHHSGDQALRFFSRVVEQQIRPYDYFGRYGGEEFLLVMPLANNTDFTALADRIRNSLASTVLTLESGEQIAITASIGGTKVYTHDDTDQAMLMRADEAVYKAKAAGRNTVVIV